ncbi:MAG: DNA-3-methyladenine glycosylase 2 family protein [Methanomassiliicoccales archaeon]|nr:MAG: DNA-3-methyladenine glycosylase 2 family protein [Methanomassiliicoccales archaeon]
MMFKDLDLDRTLSCGQVFRWKKEGDRWSGFIGGRPVTLRQRGCDIEVIGRVTEDEVLKYFRADDDLDEIYQDIMVNCGDERMTVILNGNRGLRIVRQDPWECAASYVLATFVHIPRIERMIANLCSAYGEEVEEGVMSFPGPESIASDPEVARSCGLGFRCERFVEFAKLVTKGDVDFDALREMEYDRCIKELVKLPGIGDKVADCIALFSLDHLEAFPVDVRIKKSMKHLWGIQGSYRSVSSRSRQLFGRYAGYAQEYIYLHMRERTRRLPG